jgi:hypothetical protein
VTSTGLKFNGEPPMHEHRGALLLRVLAQHELAS